MCRSLGVKVLVETQDVALKHGNGDLANEGDIGDAGHLEQRSLVHILERGHIDDGGARAHPGRGQLVRLGGHAGDDHIRLAARGFGRLGSFEKFALAHEIDRANVDRVDIGAFVVQKKLFFKA